MSQWWEKYSQWNGLYPFLLSVYCNLLPKSASTVRAKEQKMQSNPVFLVPSIQGNHRSRQQLHSALNAAKWSWADVHTVYMTGVVHFLSWRKSGSFRQFMLKHEATSSEKGCPKMKFFQCHNKFSYSAFKIKKCTFLKAQNKVFLIRIHYRFSQSLKQRPSHESDKL